MQINFYQKEFLLKKKTILQEAKKCKIANKNKNKEAKKDLMVNKILQKIKIKVLERIAIKRVFTKNSKHLNNKDMVFYFEI
jgi:hypothetical protein